MLSIGKKVCKAEARTTSVRIIYLDGHKIVAQHISINDPHKTVKKRKVAHATICLQVWVQNHYQYQQMICETFPLHVENCVTELAFLHFSDSIGPPRTLHGPCQTCTMNITSQL